ncbi:hypothetical protein Psi02_63890 [Planotetraspora silvatica]|uniref:Uncharacterized protein n=1 Tax=Planotetraspora silvatica TaxID=234614 RepID=A0A8J3V4S1_9ACTN|nr:hypothetical protein [Planotetraspora silvatica]GII49965.1 hypothetical protein Psi02_63890 [Planotetraspora silvatica]
MFTTDHRAAFITGLRALATFLETNRAVPVPGYAVRIIHAPRQSTDAEMCAEIDRIAALLGTPVDTNRLRNGHYSTGLDFGPVRYQATAVLADARARFDALNTYTDCVTPDTDATGPHAA